MADTNNTDTLVVPYMLVESEGGQSKALFCVPAEWATRMIEHPVMCREACFYLQIDQQLSEQQTDAVFLYTIFDSIEPDATAVAISKRLAIRLGDPVQMGASQLLGV